jgi:hypothetical protein
MWLELFYVYFRMLADRLCVTLGYVASSQPGAWPPEYRSIVNADVAQLRRWKTFDPKGLHEALQAHRSWFDLLTTHGNEGVRDAIVHTLAHPMVVTQLDGLEKRVTVWRETTTGHEERDLLALVHEVVNDFCRCLNSLPPALWENQRFLGTDLVLSDGEWATVKRFFPKVA